MTLIEVLAALVILGTIVALLLTVRGRYSRQLRLADQRMKAAAALDQLIGTWIQPDAVAIPIGKTGLMEGVYKLVWRTRVVPSTPARDLGARVVRVEVFPVNGNGATDDQPLLFVDLMVGQKRLLESDMIAEGESRTSNPATQEVSEDPLTFEDPRVELGVP